MYCFDFVQSPILGISLFDSQFGLLWVLIVMFKVWMLIWDLLAYVYSIDGIVLVLVKVKFDLAGSMAGQSH